MRPSERIIGMLKELVGQQEKLVGLMDERSHQRKDFWDKFAALSTFLSTVIIASIGAIFTAVYNAKQNERNEALKQQEIRISQIQTLEKFVPYLTGSEEQKRIAILGLNSLGNAEVATKLAELYPSQGTVAALKSIAKAATGEERKLANAALQRIFDYQRQAVVRVEGEYSTSAPFYSSGALITSAGHIITSDYAVTGLEKLHSARNWRIVFADGSVKPATVVSVDKERGLAVLQVPGSGYPKLQLAQASPRPGDTVMAIGTRGEAALEPSVGTIIGLENRFMEARFDSSLRGFGGGPVFNIDGMMVGLVYSGTPGDTDRRDQCIKSDIIRSYLDQLKIETF
jgi:S1-C subfamily serine protease